MIKIEIDSEPVLRKLTQLQNDAQNMQPVFATIGEYLVKATKERFQESRGPDGVPWEAISEATMINYMEKFSTSFSKKTGRITVGGTARAIGRKPLIGESKRLSREISYRADEQALEIGSPLEQAAVMHFGARKGQFGKTTRGQSIPWGDIPARPFLGISNADSAHILELIEDHLNPEK